MKIKKMKAEMFKMLIIICLGPIYLFVKEQLGHFSKDFLFCVTE